MSPRYRPIPDIDAIVIRYLLDDLDFSDFINRNIVTKLPREFDGRVTLQVVWDSGNGGRHLRRPVLDLNAYAPTSQEAYDVMAAALTSLSNIVFADLDGAVVTDFEEITTPVELDEPDERWGRRLCTIALTVHPRARRA